MRTSLAHHFTRLLPLMLLTACSSSTESAPAVSKKDAGSEARNPYPSFKDDVVPVVQASCALTACHASKDSNLGIFLGYDRAQLYAELQKPSPTASGEKFVVAGDPARSYFLVKLEGKQAALAAKCAGGSCGTEMPPGDALAAEKIEAVRAWIKEGAKDN